MLQLLCIPNTSQEWEAFLQVLDHLILHFIMGIRAIPTPHKQRLNQVCQNQLCLLDLWLPLGLHHLVHISSARSTSRTGSVQQDSQRTGFNALHLQTIQDLSVLPTVISHSQPTQITASTSSTTQLANQLNSMQINSYGPGTTLNSHTSSGHPASFQGPQPTPPTQQQMALPPGSQVPPPANNLWPLCSAFVAYYGQTRWDPWIWLPKS